jgi:uncharacterized repeat protein (TIGR04052 family)
MFKYIVLTFAAAAMLATVAQAALRHTYRIRFEAVIGGQPFHCGQSYRGVGRGKSTVTPEYFRFYVSQVNLIDDKGNRVPLVLAQDGVWQQRNVAFLSFEDLSSNCANGSPQKHEEIEGTAPAGHYTGIEFMLGVPDDLDHADATIAQSPLNLSDMFWSWQDGYKFLRFDARVTEGGQSASYIFHLGSTGCTMSNRVARCASPNRSTIVLQNFDPAKNVVVADLASMFRDADLGRLARDGGCMSSPGDACQPVMRDLGVTFRGDPAAKQQLFSVR